MRMGYDRMRRDINHTEVEQAKAARHPGGQALAQVTGFRLSGLSAITVVSSNHFVHLRLFNRSTHWIERRASDHRSPKLRRPTHRDCASSEAGAGIVSCTTQPAGDALSVMHCHLRYFIPPRQE